MSSLGKWVSKKLSAALLTLAAISILSSSALGAATIVILNGDDPGVGFNDTTPVSPVGGNPGTTLGQQRLNAMQYAANIWGAPLVSSSTITVRARWEALPCTANSGTLGSAGAANIFRDFAQVPHAGTWYGSALANALTGVDLNANHEINARFNINLGNTGCLEGSPFYLGLDANHGTGVDLVSVILHEFSHGLGFQTFTSSSTGVQAGTPPNLFPSIYDRFLLDNSTGKTWNNMTDAERQASAVNTGNLVWNGAIVTSHMRDVQPATPLLRVNSPAAIAGNYRVGTATFGAALSSPGITANVAQSAPADGCTALTNQVETSGKIALIDRGNCNFIVKVKNAQNAGAVGVIIADNVAGPVAGMSGTDATITIPSVRITLADGNTIKGQLGSGVNATLSLDFTVSAGADTAGRALMFTPNPIEAGSSVSHWDSSAFPNQLMEPNISGDVKHFVTPPYDLTTSLFRDLGWTTVNPFIQAEFFARVHYRDFFSREPDAPGLAFWTNEITSCGNDPGCIDVKRTNVSAAFYLSIEFQETGYLVYRMYKASYGNLDNGAAPVPVTFAELLPDTQQIGRGVIVGQPGWELALESNKQAFALDFVRRARFTTANGGTPTQFVDSLFSKAGITPTVQERADAINEFGGASNTSDPAARARALRRVAENPALRQLEFNKAFVLMQYFGYLRRNPNDAPDLNYAGYNFWLNKLNQFNGNFVNAEMVRSFLVSGEYRQRFGP